MHSTEYKTRGKNMILSQSRVLNWLTGPRDRPYNTYDVVSEKNIVRMKAGFFFQTRIFLLFNFSLWVARFSILIQLLLTWRANLVIPLTISMQNASSSTHCRLLSQCSTVVDPPRLSIERNSSSWSSNKVVVAERMFPHGSIASRQTSLKAITTSWNGHFSPESPTFPFNQGIWESHSYSSSCTREDSYSSLVLRLGQQRTEADTFLAAERQERRPGYFSS